MNAFVVFCACVAMVAAKPYAFTAIAPMNAIHAAAIPYSAWGAVPLAYSAPFIAHGPAPFVVPALGVKSQYHVQDIFGQASYGHAEPMQSHTAVHDAAGNKVGSFSFIKADGTIARTDYVADALGYRVASNDLPVAPVHNPVPVVDTPEVVAAKAAHMAEVAKAKSRARRQAIFPTHYAYPAFVAHHIPVVTPDGYIADTPEVALAKVAHFAAHAQAAARG